MGFPTPTAWYDRLVISSAEWQECEGVPVATATVRHDAFLFQHVAGALGLLATYAPATLEQIRALMRGVVVGPLYGARGEWRQSIRLCVLSIEYLRKEQPSAPAIAATIVHELAHARLDALGIVSTEERCGRIERICFRASQRFLQSLPASSDRDAALHELEEYLSFDTAVWRAVLHRDYRPWYVRALVYCLRRAAHLWHRGSPT